MDLCTQEGSKGLRMHLVQHWLLFLQWNKGSKGWFLDPHGGATPQSLLDRTSVFQMEN